MFTSKKNLIVALLLALGLLFTAARGEVSAEGAQTLYVADWSETTELTNIGGRPAVLKVGDVYHIWYGVSDTALYHTLSKDPDSFEAGKPTTFWEGDTKISPAEVASVTVFHEDGKYYLITYAPTGVDNNIKQFGLYTSTDGYDWEHEGIVFDGAGLPDYYKIDAPFLFKDGDTFRLYFQVKNPDQTRYDIYLAEATGALETATFALANDGKPVLSPGDTGSWDDKYVMHPWVIKDGNNYFMWYSAYGTSQVIGMSKSSDGVNWEKSPANPILGNTGEPAVINDNGTWRMWYLATGGKINYLTATGPFEFSKIQAAIDAASAGDVIEVADGTYTYQSEGEPPPAGLIKVSKPVTIKAADDGNDVRPVIDGTGFNGVFKIWHTQFTGGEVVIEGFEIVGNSATGVAITAAMWDNGAGTKIIIRDNYIHGMNSGINFWGGGFAPDPATRVVNNVEITGNIFSDLGEENATQGFGIMLEDLSGWYKAGNKFAAIVTNNTFTNIYNGTTGNFGVGIVIPRADADNGEAVNAQITKNTFQNVSVGVGIIAGDVTDTEIENNDLTGASVYGVLATGISNGPVDASPNWWGSKYGPVGEQINGVVDYTPWCADEGCTTFLPDANGEIRFPEGTYNLAGGFVVNEPGLTIILEDGAVIQNDSPCFIVNASNTTIKAETPGGAKCVPTKGSNGIDVAADLSGIRIINLEIDGTGQTTGDGIHFAGAVTDFQIVDNYIHDLGGDGVEFAGVVAGDTQEIQGNLFRNTGLAINAGSNTINAEYNSWGQYAGTTIASVDTDPWTHVDLYAEPLGTASGNQVFVNGQFSIMVKANLQNVTGASFEFHYPTAKLDLVSATATGAFDPIASGGSVLDTSTDGVIRFDGQKILGVSEADVELFTAVFEAKVAGEAAFSFDVDTDKFAMSPGSGPSNYIYAAALTGATVQVVAPPTITSTDIQGYYLTGDSQQFSVRTENPSTGGTYGHVLFNYVIENAVLTDIANFEYSDGTNWHSLQLQQDGENVIGSFGPTGGFPMDSGYTATTKFRITFATAKPYPFTLTLNDLDADNYELAKFTGTANVYTPPTLSSTDIAGPYLGGVEKEFHVTLENPDAGIATNVKARFTLYGASLLDITSIQYYEVADSSWYDLPIEQAGSDLVGYFGPSAGFPITAPYNSTSAFRVTFANGITKSYSYEIELFDMSTMPDRLLDEMTGQINVYANYILTGTFSMQGRVFRGGVPVTLTGPVGFAFGPYTALSTDVLGANWTLNNVADAVYTITTNQPRYLNVTADLGKTIAASLDQIIAALELKGGDATLDNQVGLADASAVGSDYGLTGDRNADVNFSGKVDIFDLALVGGNYGLTSATAYVSWTP